MAVEQIKMPEDKATKEENGNKNEPPAVVQGRVLPPSPFASNPSNMPTTSAIKKQERKKNINRMNSRVSWAEHDFVTVREYEVSDTLSTEEDHWGHDKPLCCSIQ